MSLPEIRFEDIRPLDGSKHTGFEELCTQLAALEPASPEAEFIRKGRGGDGGVECFQKNPDGSETGWQAKYLFQWDDNLKAQLDESIKTALAKHPQLTEYIVCLPFDFPDARIANRKSARQKWEAWKTSWMAKAKAQGRTLSFSLWGKSQLVGRLTKDAGLFSGRTLYWFGTEWFTPEWFREQFEKTKEALGSRYTPESNVELSIRRDFLALSRDAGLQKEIDAAFVRISDKGRSGVTGVARLLAPNEAHLSANLQAAVDAISELARREPVRSDQVYPFAEWISAIEKCTTAASDVLYRLYDQTAEKNPAGDGISSARHAIRYLLDALEDAHENFSAQRWHVANAKAVLLTGAAGTGKSHLLADVVEHEVLSGRPAIMVLGSSLRDNEPWRQILTELDRPATEQVKQFLGALDAAAESFGGRALICVDALNERNGMHIWPHRLAAFLKGAEGFPRIAIVVSCRTTYVNYVVPDDLGPDKLLRIDHKGFADEGGRAAAVYLDKRGVVRPGAPNLVPEFNNPLFLKTCCDSLQKEGKRELPRGLRGVTSIFSFYNAAVERAINQRLHLDPGYKLVGDAIVGFAELLVTSERGSLNKRNAIAFFEKLRPSNARRDESLLTQLVIEGLLSEEIVRGDDGSIIEIVRFTFERFSDHAIAQHLLSKFLIDADVPQSFAPGSRLFDVVAGDASYERAGIVEAIAIQLPERTGVELVDACPQKSSILRQAFIDSLLWREQSRFTTRTFDIAQEELEDDAFNDLLVAVSTEPENKFNAAFIHTSLKKRPLPDRDAFWSTYLIRKEFSGEVETVVTWALTNGNAYIDEVRAYLAGLILTWFFTTSHRPIRDRATKALASLLAPRLGLAARLLQEFDGIDDPYVTERLLAACYGAALQGRGNGLGELAQTVYRLIFQGGMPIVDALTRDHANGIVEYARWRKVLPADVDLRACRPPYRSPWPIEYVSDELIASYVQTIKGHTFRDDIVGSTINDGDFARYQMDHTVSTWSPAPLGTKNLPDHEELFGAWHQDFLTWASSAQKTAFTRLRKAAVAAGSAHDHEGTPEVKRRKSARNAFRSQLTDFQWEDFRVRADWYLRFVENNAYWQGKPAEFDTHWARRWVCKRAHDLGWTPERFASIERNGLGSYGRMDHRIERIGKKYQWIAWRELIARMADNLAYIGEYGERDTPGGPKYTGARRVGLRDMDPSLLTLGTYYESFTEWPRTWWVPVQPNFRPMEPRERLAWLDSDQDIIKGQSLIEVVDPKTRRQWLVLSTFAQWRSHGLRDGEKELQRDTWFKLRCLVTRKADLKALVAALKARTLADSRGPEDIELNSDFYLGEFPWHPDLANVDEWTNSTQYRAPPVPVRLTTARFSRESGGYDFSLERTVSLEIPAPWLASAMGLHWANGHHPVYEDAANVARFVDPSIDAPGPTAALVDRDSFLKVLEREGLAAVWILSGEKSAYGGRDAGRGFGGSITHSTLYNFDGAWHQSPTKTERAHPAAEQLAEFFGDDAMRAAAVAARTVRPLPSLAAIRLIGVKPALRKKSATKAAKAPSKKPGKKIGKKSGKPKRRLP